MEAVRPRSPSGQDREQEQGGSPSTSPSWTGTKYKGKKVKLPLAHEDFTQILDATQALQFEEGCARAQTSPFKIQRDGFLPTTCQLGTDDSFLNDHA
ncbi:hypothetical protein ATANTOWER_010776 [Ataeniobius toweri]|uniref:Uncharacterized protein n=1 Tax=Ataeniobius toweri TaxID=208326 RepID=A0ABU7AEE3_9TELE|nr:hypothetical protein [Ataeniobius toweri]